MPSKLKLTFIDHSREKSSVEFRGTTLTAANFDAQMTLMDALRDATDAITLGNLNRTIRYADVVDSTNVPPIDKNAQRERKWLVEYEDINTFRKATLEIPTADLTFVLPNTDILDITIGLGNVFASAFQGYQVSRAGNPVQVIQVTHVGRNL